MLIIIIPKNFTSVADLKGSRGHKPTRGRIFLGIFNKNCMLMPPPPKVGTPPQGNPGPATAQNMCFCGLTCRKKQWSLFP